jgi:molybdopterin/thiamine biosynthesis adenylyltransferase
MKDLKFLKTSESAPSRPVLLDLAKVKDENLLKKLHSQNAIRHIIDDYQEQLKELFEINNTSLVYSAEFNGQFQDYLKKLSRGGGLIHQGKWVYFPWACSLVHILSEPDFFKIRTARNRNLITAVEQKKFYNSVVGIAGLSVGNSAALAIVLQGGAKHIKLADHDRLALSNTNRIRTGITSLGLLKVEMTARQIYELNPYAKVETFPEGLNEKNANFFCTGLDIIVDEVDNLAVKYLLREQAKSKKLPLVMAADNGDNGIVDVERYDLNPKLKFFHGRLGDITYKELIRLTKFDTGRLITKHLGLENVTVRMQASLAEMGKTIVSWPQLGGAALLNGSAIAYCVRRIVNKQSLEHNRAIISLEQGLQSDYFSKANKLQRNKSIKIFKKVFGL